MTKSQVEVSHLKDMFMNNIGIIIRKVIYGEDIKLDHKLMIVEFMNIIGINHLHLINLDIVKHN